MPARQLELRTITAATLGLCLAAAGAAWLFVGSGADDGVVLVGPPVELILIEDDPVWSGVGLVSGDAWRQIVIEDDETCVLAEAGTLVLIEDEPGALADATAPVVVEDDRSQRLLAALVGSAAVAFAQPARMPSTAASGAPRRDFYRPAESERAEPGLAAPEDPLATAASAGPAPAALAMLRAVELVPPEPPDRGAIEAAVRRQLPQVRACYERELKSDPHLRGRMVLAMDVTASGVVSDARVDGDEVGDPELNECVGRAIHGFRFPRSSEGYAVEYPVQFSAGW